MKIEKKTIKFIQATDTRFILIEIVNKIKEFCYVYERKVKEGSNKK